MTAAHFFFFLNTFCFGGSGTYRCGGGSAGFRSPASASGGSDSMAGAMGISRAAPDAGAGAWTFTVRCSSRAWPRRR